MTEAVLLQHRNHFKMRSPLLKDICLKISLNLRKTVRSLDQFK